MKERLHLLFTGLAFGRLRKYLKDVGVEVGTYQICYRSLPYICKSKHDTAYDCNDGDTCYLVGGTWYLIYHGDKG